MSKLSKATISSIHEQMQKRLRSGEDNVVVEMIALELDLDAEVNGSRALVVAAEVGNMSECIALLDGGANIDLPGKGGRTAVHDAIRSRNLNLVKLLIGRGADISLKDPFGNAPIHSSAHWDDVEFCDAFVAAGAGIDELCGAGRSPLHYAAITGSLRTAAWLLERGAELDRVDAFGETPLHMAVVSDRVEACRFLVERGASPSAVPSPVTAIKHKDPILSPFQYAVREGRVEAARYFISECHEDLAQRTLTGRTLVQLAGKNKIMLDLLRSSKAEQAVRAGGDAALSGDTPSAARPSVTPGVL
jgi:ankyrin repeat protein